MLIVADPHFGKAALFRKQGIAVPAGTIAADLQRLDAAVSATGAIGQVIPMDAEEKRDTIMNQGPIMGISAGNGLFRTSSCHDFPGHGGAEGLVAHGIGHPVQLTTQPARRHRASHRF
jgi:hypothetical protein